MEDDRLPFVIGFSLFPARQGVQPECDLEVPKDCLQIIGLRPIMRRHRTLTVDGFDIGKLERLKDYVEEMDGISFVVKEYKYRRNIPGLLKQMTGYYKYSSLFQTGYYKGKYLDGEDDEVLAVISFFKLPYCVPIFNPKRVDGMAVSYCEAIRKESERRSHLVKKLRVDLALTNYEDNLFVIDGVAVNQKNPFGDKWVREIGNWVANELPIKSRKELEAKKKTSNISFDQLLKESAEDTLKNQTGPVVEIVQNGYNNVQWAAGTTTTMWTTDSSSSND
jgi:hypothetical protein